MTRSRRQQISLDSTPFYHVVSRCVRRAFLCGMDQLTGRSYEHRRQQIQDDILQLGSISYIDCVAFCVMSNHFHILHVNRDDCLAASAQSVVERRHRLFFGTEISRKFTNNEPLEKKGKTPIVILDCDIAPGVMRKPYPS